MLGVCVVLRTNTKLPKRDAIYTTPTKREICYVGFFPFFFYGCGDETTTWTFMQTKMGEFVLLAQVFLSFNCFHPSVLAKGLKGQQRLCMLCYLLSVILILLPFLEVVSNTSIRCSIHTKQQIQKSEYLPLVTLLLPVHQAVGVTGHFSIPILKHFKNREEISNLGEKT